MTVKFFDNLTLATLKLLEHNGKISNFAEENYENRQHIGKE